MLKSLYIALLMTVALASASLADKWLTYVNERFGATAEIPSGYRPGAAPANDDGRSFFSPDGEAKILVWGAFATLNEESFADYAKRRVSYDRDDGWNVSYSTGKADWFAFSGSKADRIFYEKVIRACDGQIANHVRLEYPAPRKKEFDPIVKLVTQSLRSKKGYQC